MSKSVLITGGAGSVGRSLASKFQAEGHPVRIFDLPICNFEGLEGVEGIEVVKGDLTQPASLQEAVKGVDAVIHLAALLPPVSEQNRARTFAVNVDGTAHLTHALKKSNPQALFVFSSSVSTYGDTTVERSLIGVDHPQQALDLYAESKIAGERVVKESLLPSVILRIAGIAVPAFQEPPAVWPFMAEQRLELIHREDVVMALFKAVITSEARGMTLNIAGGASWQMRGKEYVERWSEIIGVPFEEARFLDRPGWVDWYHTTDSQRLLAYQNHSFPQFLEELRAEVDRLMNE